MMGEIILQEVERDWEELERRYYYLLPSWSEELVPHEKEMWDRHFAKAKYILHFRSCMSMQELEWNYPTIEHPDCECWSAIDFEPDDLRSIIPQRVREGFIYAPAKRRAWAWERKMPALTVYVLDTPRNRRLLRKFIARASKIEGRPIAGTFLESADGYLFVQSCYARVKRRVYRSCVHAWQAGHLECTEEMITPVLLWEAYTYDRVEERLARISGVLFPNGEYHRYHSSDKIQEPDPRKVMLASGLDGYQKLEI